MGGAVRRAVLFAGRVFGNNRTVHANLATGDAKLAVTEDVGLYSC